MIGPALRSLLLADATAFGLVGTRIYAVQLPQDVTYPAITYTTISGYRPQHTRGSAGLSGPRIQLDFWALGYIQAHALAEAVRLVLQSFQGEAAGVTIQGIFFDSERDMFDPDAGQDGAYRVSADYFVFYEETEATA